MKYLLVLVACLLVSPLHGQEHGLVDERALAVERMMIKYSDFKVSRDLAEKIYDYSQKWRIDVEVAFGLVRVESNFVRTAKSHVGARGLTQLMPGTAAGLGVRNIIDVDENLNGGFRYLRIMLNKYNENDHLALLAYNRGPGTVDKKLRARLPVDNGYPAMVKKRILVVSEQPN